MADDVPETVGEHPDLVYTRPEQGESAEPDVLLDIPVVQVEKIKLDVEDLRARVSLEADVLDLLRLHVGVDAVLGRVNLEIDGVDAQAMLKVRLDNVAEIISDVLRTIDHNPELVTRTVGEAASAARDVGRDVSRAAPEAVRSVTDAARDVQLPLGHEEPSEPHGATPAEPEPEPAGSKPEPEPAGEPRPRPGGGAGRVDLKATLRDLRKAAGRAGARQLSDLSKRLRRKAMERS